jgi:hypothetical protein
VKEQMLAAQLLEQFSGGIVSRFSKDDARADRMLTDCVNEVRS